MKNNELDRSAQADKAGEDDVVEKLRREMEAGRRGPSPGADRADDPTVEMFEEGEGKREDGSRGLPKITMSTIRALPDRCKQSGELGAPMRIALFTGVATGIQQATKADTDEIFFGLKGDFAAVRYDSRGEPDAIFKSDTLYFPIGHQQALDKVERTGFLAFSLEFWAAPAKNPAGYSWSYYNLAKLDRNNLSAIDRAIMMSVKASRALADKPASGLLADLRSERLTALPATEAK